MLVSEANVETERASRYLVQLCQHLTKVGRANPMMQVRVECSDDQGVVSFDWGRCTLRALGSVLMLHVEAPEEEAIARLEHRVADLLEGIGRRDQLTVTWAPPQGVEERSSAPRADHGGHTHG